MKIGILSFRPLSREVTYEELRLQEVAEALGHDVLIFRAEECQLVYDEQGERVFHRGQPLPKIDVLIPRATVLWNADLRLAIVHQFELMGVPVLNTFDAIVKGKNKLRTMQILHEKGVPVPRTITIENYEAIDAAISLVGPLPVILKEAFGTFGSGVVIAESKRAMRSM